MNSTPLEMLTTRAVVAVLNPQAMLMINCVPKMYGSITARWADVRKPYKKAKIDNKPMDNKYASSLFQHISHMMVQ